MNQRDLNKLHAARKAVPNKIYVNEFGDRFKGTEDGRLAKVTDSQTVINQTVITTRAVTSSSSSAGSPAVSGSNGSFTFNTVTFGNLNGLSFYTSNGSVVGSYTVPGGGSPNFSAGTTSNNLPSVVFSNSNGVSFGLNGSTITASHNGLTTQTVQPVAISGSNGSFTYNTVTFGALNGVTFYTSNGSIVASYTVPSVTNSSWTASAGTQSATVSQLVWSNSNGISFGLDNGTITASHNGLTSQTVQTQNMVSILGSTGDISFANSNGITFGGNASTVTASHNGLTTQTVQPVAVSGSNGSFVFSTVTMGNLNGLSFYTSNGSVVGSYTVPIITNSSWTASAGTKSETISQLIFSDSNGISFGLDSGTITARHDGITVESKWTVRAGGVTETVSLLNFKNSNGISFGLNLGDLTASHDGLTQQSTQPVAISGSNGSFNFSTVTFGNLNGMSFYSSNGSMVGSYTVPTVTNSSWTVSDSATSGTVGRLAFTNLNGVTLSLSSGTGGLHTIVGSHNGLTSQSNQALSGSNGSFTFQTVTFGNLNGASFYSSNGSMVLSYTVPAAGGAMSLSAGTTSNTYNSLVFSNANGVSFGLNGSTMTASVNAGGGSNITLSMWPERLFNVAPVSMAVSGTTGNTGGSLQITASYYLASIQIPHPVAFSQLYGIHINNTTSAGTGSVTLGHAIGIYTLNANTALSLVSSFQWFMHASQNSITARTHRWFWGTNSTSNSSSLSGNVSASFTNAAGAAGRRILMYNEAATLTEGNYYLASVYTIITTGVNFFHGISQACPDNVATISAVASMMGESRVSRFLGWNGAFSSTSNRSALEVPIMPSSIHTSVITISASVATQSIHRLPYIILERSIS